jgi:predicted lipoprotein with Yx(FWY)xxD motif
MRRSFPATVLVATALTLIVAACGSVETETAPASVTEVTVPAPSAGVIDEIAAPVPWISVASSSLGQILVDGQGLSMYLVSSGVCVGSCAGIWPPVPYDDVAVIGDGIDGSLLGQTERVDGFLQATYNRHPLYLYSGDSAPGDVNGQGVNDVWFAVDATGSGVGADFEDAPDEQPASDPDYDY